MISVNWRLATLVCAALLAAPTIARAQSGRSRASSQRCGWKPSDAWARRQAEFFDDSGHDWTNDTLRAALLNAAGIEGTLTPPIQFGVQIEGREPAYGAGASPMVAQLMPLATARGATWPGKSVVGAAGAHAVYLLALRDTGFARAALHRMMEAGPAESPAPDVATLEDRLRLVWGRKQIYGTQFRIVSGAAVLAPMEDSAHADLRREDAGLPPLAVGLCLARASAK